MSGSRNVIAVFSEERTDRLYVFNKRVIWHEPDTDARRLRIKQRQYRNTSRRTR